MWRETQAKVIAIPECPSTGSIDIKQLEYELERYQDHHLLVGSFSAASNVTGIRSDTKSISKILHKYNAVACFDFAAAGPHVTMDMKYHDMDAMYLSTHKFVGGPQTPGILIARRSLFSNKKYHRLQVPTVPGGGTVDYVQPHSQSYCKDIEHREEGGTPGIIESIRAGLVLQLHSKVDTSDGNVKNNNSSINVNNDKKESPSSSLSSSSSGKGGGWIERTEARYLKKALTKWRKNPNIILLGNQSNTKQRVPIVSFMIKIPDDVSGTTSSTGGVIVSTGGSGRIGNRNLLHHNFIVALLNDIFGIQSRGGCSCAGPLRTFVITY